MYKNFLVAFVFLLCLGSVLGSNQMVIHGTSSVDGNLNVQIYSAASGGTKIYDSGSDFNGFLRANQDFNIVLGQSTIFPSHVRLDWNKTTRYFMDMNVNGVNASFGGADRTEITPVDGNIYASDIVDGTSVFCTASNGLCTTSNGVPVTTVCSSGCDYTSPRTAAIALGSGGGTIYIKRGTYNIDQNIPWFSGTNFTGDGDSTVLRITAHDINVFEMQGTNATHRILATISNLTISETGTGRDFNSNGIWIGYAHRVNVRNVLFYRIAGAGMVLYDVDDGVFDGLTFQEVGEPSKGMCGLDIQTSSSDGSTANYFSNVGMEVNYFQGICMQSGSNGNKFVNFKIHGATSAASRPDAYMLLVASGSNYFANGEIDQFGRTSGTNAAVRITGTRNKFLNMYCLTGTTTCFEAAGSAQQTKIENSSVFNLQGGVNTHGFDVAGDESTLIGNDVNDVTGNGYLLNGNHMVVAGNRATANELHGFDLNTFDYGSFTGNQSLNNSQAGTALYDGVILYNSDSATLSSNVIKDTQGTRTQLHGLFVTKDSNFNVIVGNNGVLSSNSGTLNYFEDENATAQNYKEANVWFFTGLGKTIYATPSGTTCTAICLGKGSSCNQAVDLNGAVPPNSCNDTADPHYCWCNN